MYFKTELIFLFQVRRQQCEDAILGDRSVKKFEAGCKAFDVEIRFSEKVLAPLLKKVRLDSQSSQSTSFDLKKSIGRKKNCLEGRVGLAMRDAYSLSGARWDN